MVSALHFDFGGDAILFDGLRLNSLSAFLLASLLTIITCLAERFSELALARRWTPSTSIKHSRIRFALWTAGLYWLTTFMKLILMIIAMSCHLGLIIVTTQAIIHFLTELKSNNECNDNKGQYTLVDSDSHALSSTIVTTRPRSKSKPDAIFIHPAHNNLARADAAAQELGLQGDTDLVKSTRIRTDEQEWQTGKGRGVARALMGSSLGHDKDTNHFTLGDDDQLDSDSSN